MSASKSPVLARLPALSLLVGCGLLATASPRAQAQDLMADDLLFEDIPSVFGASKYEQKVTDAPASVTVITADELRRAGHQTLGEALRMVRGAYVSNDRSYDYFSLRGFSPAGSFNSRVLLLIDGHPVNDTLFGAVPLDRTLPVHLSNIERIEIIRGPGSALYGTNAVLGVINVVTRRGRDVAGTEVSVQGDSFGSGYGRATYGQRYSSGVEVLISATGGASRGRDFHFEEFENPDGTGGDAIGLDGRRSYGGELRLGIKDFRLTAMHGTRIKDVPTAAYEVIFADPGSWFLDSLSVLGFSWSRRLGEVAELTTQGHLRYYRFEGEYPYDVSEEGDPEDRVVNRDDLWSTTAVAEARVSTDPLRGHRLTGGTEVRFTPRVVQKNYDIRPFESYLDDTRSLWTVGVFGQDAWEATRWLTVHAGGRYDQYSTFGGVFNPRAGLILKPHETTRIKALYGTAYRAPNAYELYYHDGGWSTEAPKSLDPERIQTLELVLEQQMGTSFRGSLGGFHYELTDLLVMDENPNSGLLAFHNGGAAHADGLEAELEVLPSARVHGRMSWTLQWARDDETGEHLVNAPVNIALAELTVPLLDDRLAIHPEARFMDEVHTMGRGHLDAALVADLMVSSTDLVPGLTASVGVRNLLDKEYYTPASDELEQEAILQDGRSIRGDLTYAF